jgi:hypothetical protein
MKFSKLVVVAGAAAMILTSAAPAFAATATLTATPNKVYQGGSFALKAQCPRDNSGVITSVLLPRPVRLRASHHAQYVLVNVGASVAPGTYKVTLRCYGQRHHTPPRNLMAAQTTASGQSLMAARTVMGGTMGGGGSHVTCSANTWVTVLKHTSPTPPHKGGHHYLRMIGKKPVVIINTGFGGMAPAVSQHYPAAS